MSLTGVRMTEEVWLACLGHALTTEKEEIMGLLLGDIHHADDGSVTAFIWGASPQVRSDRRKDRVETNPEQLAAASAQAEMMTVKTGRPTRVIGWYHSHPHITVMPSHVDVRTQAMYQLLDLGFVGLIFSCFNEDTQKIGKIQVIAFQSLDGRQQHAPIINKTSVIEVESSWSSSENALSTSGSTLIESLDKDTADSRLAKASKVLGESSEVEFSHADGNFVGRDKTSLGSLIPYDASSNSIAVEMDSMDMTASMQEALHRSNMDMSGAEYVRKEIPLQVLPNWALFKLDSPLSSFKDVQYVLFEEERSAYKQALLHNMRDGNMHPLAFIHHTSTYQASLCKLMEYCLIPAINALQDRLKENEVRLVMLLDEAKSLLEPEVLGREIKMTSDSQRRTDAYGSRTNKAISPRDSPPSSDSTGLRSHSGVYGRSRKAS